MIFLQITRIITRIIRVYYRPNVTALMSASVSEPSSLSDPLHDIWGETDQKMIAISPANNNLGFKV